MFRVSCLLFCATLTLCSAAAAGPREDAEARAALDLALALQRSAKDRPPVAAHKAERLTWGEAFERSLKEGKAVLLRINSFDCLSACEQCEGCLLADAAEFFSDPTPRLILAYPSGNKLYHATEWRHVPAVTEVRSAVARIADPNCSSGR